MTADKNSHSKRIRRVLCALALGGAALLPASAQQVALKTNLLYDATTTPNLGLEVSVAPRHSLQLTYALNPWDSDSRYIKHWLLMPEYRYWFCQEFNGWFLGVHGMGGQFNVNDVHIPLTDIFQKGKRTQGWYVGGGISGGYQFILGKHWNLETSLGVGYDYVQYDRYMCGECGKKDRSGHDHYVGLTKAVISLLYLF